MVVKKMVRGYYENTGKKLIMEEGNEAVIMEEWDKSWTVGCSYCWVGV